MAMTTKVQKNNTETRRRTLRSGAKFPLQDNNSVYPTASVQVLNQIKIQIEHQQANNATKSSFLNQEDVKCANEQFPQSEFLSKCILNADSQNKKCQASNNNIFVLRPSSSSLDAAENSLEEGIKSIEQLEKKQTLLSTPPAKSCIKSMKKTQSSPYHEERRSFRKIKKDQVHLIPFRKCQDQFENRIVVLINKICQNKHNQKEIQILCQKIHKISIKDMSNPYVVSGIQTVLKLLLQKHSQSQSHVQTFSKLKSQVKNLSEKIWLELGKDDDYEYIAHEEKLFDFEITRPKLVRRIFKMLMKRKEYEPNYARQESYKICESFISKNKDRVNESEIMDFLREQKFLLI